MSASNAQAQQDTNKAMLERMALFEQQVLNLQTALSNASDTTSASQSQYGLSVWEQTFWKKLDTVTLVHAEHFTISNHTNSTTCVNPECDLLFRRQQSTAHVACQRKFWGSGALIQSARCRATARWSKYANNPYASTVRALCSLICQQETGWRS